MAARKCRLFSDVAALRLAARKPRSTRKHRTSFGKILLIVTTLSGEGSASLAVRRTLNGTRSVSLTLCFFQVDRTVTSAEAGESSGYRNFATFCRLTYVGAGIVTTHTMLASPDCRRLTARVVRVFPRRCASSPSLFLFLSLCSSRSQRLSPLSPPYYGSQSLSLSGPGGLGVRVLLL